MGAKYISCCLTDHSSQYLTDHIQTMNIPGMGEVNVSVKNGLAAGDEVLLIQKRGGQRYLVVDRWQKGV